MAGGENAVGDLIAPACIGAISDRHSRADENVDLPRPRRWARRSHNVCAFGVDIALWDILGKATNKPIYELLGGAQCEKLPAYASLLKYADKDVVVRTSEEALGRGYRDLKVHETGREEITATAQILRRHNGGALMVDVNAPWTLQEALCGDRAAART